MVVFIRYITLYFCLFLGSTTCFAQSNISVSAQITNQYFQQMGGYNNETRKFIKLSNKTKPISLVAGSLIYFYQNVVSEQLQAGCTYNISCSQYIKLCIAKYGFVKGTFAGLHQFVKCADGNHSNHLAYKINENNKISNQVSDEYCK
jgi:putative component of membrane protein insertase Oxa1/YidC/SpoIIIJ protein YidD